MGARLSCTGSVPSGGFSEPLEISITKSTHKLYCDSIAGNSGLCCPSPCSHFKIKMISIKFLCDFRFSIGSAVRLLSILTSYEGNVDFFGRQKNGSGLRQDIALTSVFKTHTYGDLSLQGITRQSTLYLPIPRFVAIRKRIC